MRRRLWQFVLPCLAWMSAAAPALAADVPAPSSAEGLAFFERKIRPVLVEHCYKCHSAEAEKPKGGLLLDHRQGLLNGGSSKQPAVVPHEPDKSLLIRAIRHEDEELQMPPKEKLSDQQIADFVTWIKMGAPDPRTGTVVRPPTKAEEHWSFVPPKMPAVPQVKASQWAKTDIDRFILAQLESKNLSPAGPADRLTLIRRATFDLTGLPPTPEEVEAFLNDKSPTAFEKVVDRLLASPHYGERWGRHWLDVVRFGETQGFERNRIRENAWRYRDWVIDAFNRDLPYDEFVRLQIAGDVLRPGDLDALVATGYHVIGTWDQVAHFEGQPSMQKLAREDALEDLVATAGQAFLGLTINCARCHNHKFDPVSRREYYQFAALLAGVNQEKTERRVEGASHDAARAAAARAKRDAVVKELAALEAELRAKYADGAAGGIEGLRAVYRFDEGKSADAPSDTSGVGAPLELRKAGAPRWSTAEPPHKLVK